MAKLSVQIYSLKQEISDFENTLKAVAAAGYDGVEFCGNDPFYGNMDAAELKSFLENLGLVSSGAHVSYMDMRTRLDDIIAYHKILGSKYIIVPSPNRENDIATRKAWELMNADMLEWNKIVRAAGLVLGWHNHADEMQIFDGEYAFDIILSGDDSMIYEPDTYWVEYADISAVNYLEKIANRTPLIHLKDMKILPDGKKESTVYGEGVLDNHAIVKKSLELGAEWLVIEWEDFGNDGIKAVTDSIKNLKEIIKSC